MLYPRGQEVGLIRMRSYSQIRTELRARLRNRILDLIPHVFSLLVDFGVCWLIAAIWLPQYPTWQVALAVPIAIRVLLLLWKFYSALKILLWIASVLPNRKKKQIADQLAVLNFPDPPMMMTIIGNEPQSYFEWVASREEATKEDIYAAAFLAGTIEGVKNVSFFSYRLGVVDMKDGIDEYHDQFVWRQGERVHRSKISATTTV